MRGGTNTVVVITTPGSGTVVQGFTLENGVGIALMVDRMGDITPAGGGVLMVATSATLRANVIRDNHACVGSGVYVTSGGPTIADNTIIQNTDYPVCSQLPTVDRGAGGVQAPGTSVILERNIISANQGAGGGLYLTIPGSLPLNGGAPPVEDNVITNNVGTAGV